MLARLKCEKIARKYARAYLRLYQAVLTQADINNIKECGAVLKNHVALAYLENPLLSERYKERVVSTILAHYALHESFKKIINLLIRQNRLALLYTIISCIVEEYVLGLGVLYVEVTTSSLLTKEQENFVCDQLQALFNKPVQGSFKVDAALIYGMRLRSKTMLFDNSVARKLKEAQQELLRQVEI